MALRTGMRTIVNKLRERTAAAYDDEFGGVQYWSDDQLQDILDQHKRISHYPLSPAPYTDTDEQEYGRHTWTPRNRAEMYEEDLTAVFDITGGSDLVGAGTATIDYATRLVTYTAAYLEDAATTTHEIVVVAYDLNEAAFEVWETKAAQREAFIRTKAGAHTMDLQQEWEHCIAMANRLRNRKVRAHRWGRSTPYATSWTRLGKT